MVTAGQPCPYAYECLTCMCVCAPRMPGVWEVREKPWNWSSRLVGSTVPVLGTKPCPCSWLHCFARTSVLNTEPSSQSCTLLCFLLVLLFFSYEDWGVGDSKCEPHTCTGSPLSTEPSSQPLVWTILNICVEYCFILKITFIGNFIW